MRTLTSCPICSCESLHSQQGFDIKPGPDVFRALGLGGEKSRWSICKRCAFLFQNPRPSFEAILTLYESGLYRQNRQYTEQFFQNRYERPLHHLHWAAELTGGRVTGKVLDIGAGHGGAVKAFIDSGIDASGLELDPNLVASAKKRFSVNLETTSIEEADYSPGTFDLIYSSHVHEHFDDFEAINRKLVTWLKPGGLFLCVLPTFRYAGTNGRGFINVFHNSMFTATSLHNMFIQCGLTPLQCRYPFHRSLPEVWGLARKEDGILPDYRKDNWRWTSIELTAMPHIWEGYYKYLSFIPCALARVKRAAQALISRGKR